MRLIGCISASECPFLSCFLVPSSGESGLGSGEVQRASETRGIFADRFNG